MMRFFWYLLLTKNLSIIINILFVLPGNEDKMTSNLFLAFDRFYFLITSSGDCSVSSVVETCSYSSFTFTGAFSCNIWKIRMSGYFPLFLINCPQWRVQERNTITLKGFLSNWWTFCLLDVYCRFSSQTSVTSLG